MRRVVTGDRARCPGPTTTRTTQGTTRGATRGTTREPLRGAVCGMVGGRGSRRGALEFKSKRKKWTYKQTEEKKKEHSASPSSFDSGGASSSPSSSNSSDNTTAASTTAASTTPQRRGEGARARRKTKARAHDARPRLQHIRRADRTPQARVAWVSNSTGLESGSSQRARGVERRSYDETGRRRKREPSGTRERSAKGTGTTRGARAMLRAFARAACLALCQRFRRA